MDVEGAEWESMYSMLRSKILARVKQFGLEIHVQRSASATKLYQYWSVLHQLEEQGFRRWYWAINYRGVNVYMEPTGTRSQCYEMVYINVNYLHRDLKDLH